MAKKFREKADAEATEEGLEKRLLWIDKELEEDCCPNERKIYAKILTYLERNSHVKLALASCSCLVFVHEKIILVAVKEESDIQYLKEHEYYLKRAFAEYYKLPVYYNLVTINSLRETEKEIDYLERKNELCEEDDQEFEEYIFYGDGSVETKGLTKDQQQAFSALKSFLNSSDRCFRLSGYAGTGKSFLIAKYMQWLQEHRITYGAACPTNKAAKNLRRMTVEAKLGVEVITVAQLLGQQPILNEETGKEEFQSNGKDNFSGYKVVLIDEYSMVNQENFREILDKAYENECKVIFVGDPAQLPPINEQEPLAYKTDMPGVNLTEVVRYQGDIAKIAESLRSGFTNVKFTTTADKSVICLTENEWLKQAMLNFESDLFKADADYCRFLAWRNNTVNSLNDAVRVHLWGKEVNPFVPGDKLIARKPLFRPKPGASGKNKWRIFINNSEEATVVKEGELTELKFNRQIYKYWKVLVQPEMGGKEVDLVILHEDSKKLQQEKIKEYAAKKQWSAYFDLSRMFDDVTYAYALTVHKAQGSTIENVFLDVVDIKQSRDKYKGMASLRQKLLYTAVTRASKCCYVLE